MLCRIRSYLAATALACSLSLPLAGCGSALSREKEIELGQQAAPQFEQEGGGPIPDPQIQQYVRSVGQRLLETIPAEERRDLPWEFFTLDSGVINAFAIPGGKVFITRGLLAELETESQMAGILGHEIGHVVAEHIGKQIARAQGLQIITGVAGAVSESQWVDLIGGTSGNLYLLKFGRGQELEADRLGMEYNYRAGYKPGAMRKVMKILKEAGGGGGVEFFSTHPHPDNRLEQADELLETNYADSRDNPQYKDNAEQYQSNVLARLRQLPPPRHTGEERE